MQQVFLDYLKTIGLVDLWQSGDATALQLLRSKFATTMQDAERVTRLVQRHRIRTLAELENFLAHQNLALQLAPTFMYAKATAEEIDCEEQSLMTLLNLHSSYNFDTLSVQAVINLVMRYRDHAVHQTITRARAHQVLVSQVRTAMSKMPESDDFYARPLLIYAQFIQEYPEYTETSRREL